MKTTTCQTCRNWTRNPAKDGWGAMYVAPRSPEYGRCCHPHVKSFDDVVAGPDDFRDDGLYAEGDWTGFEVFTGQDFGCIHWTEAHDDDHAE